MVKTEASQGHSPPTLTALFVTCLCDTFYPEIARSTTRVLERLGLTVACPPDQTCCGQPMFNAGYFDKARGVARRFVEVFEKAPGVVIAPSSSCAAMVREHYVRLFEGEPEWLERALGVGERTLELCEFLVDRLGVDLAALGARFDGSVTYHHSCHFRSLGLGPLPAGLIAGIPGIDFRPLEGMEECCGFGGTFSLNFPHVSEAMAAEKVRRIQETGADRLVFADAGCAMNITGYANRIGRPIKAMHIAELIDRALGG